MKFQSLRYLTREGFRNVWVNRLMSVASIGVLVACMVLIGMAILLTKNVDAAMSNLEQQNVVLVYFNDKNSVLYQGASEIDTADTSSNASLETDASSNDSSSNESDDSDSSDTSSDTSSTVTDSSDIPESSYLIHNEEEAKAVCKDIEKLENVEKVEFISSTEALKRAKSGDLKDLGESFSLLEEENPMSHGARVTFKSMEKFDQTVTKIQGVRGVHSIVSHRELAKTITDIKSGISMICFWIIAILGIISLVIVSNTIRVTMYNRKLEISIMKAVGATDAFIRLPFVIEGMILGLISAIISEGLLYFCYRVAGEAMSESLQLSIPFMQEAWKLFGIFAIIGVVAGAFGSLIMIRKYLKKEGSEFKAL